MSGTESPSQPWWHEFFDDEYAAYGLANTDPAIDNEIADFIVKTMDLKPGETLFDQCCGIGRLSIPMAQRGLRIIGVDRVQSYIDAATKRAAELDFPCAFHCDDAFSFRAPQLCDAAINWFTSFGYWPDDEQNIQMLERVFESLRPGGRFMLDYLNMPMIFRQYRTTYVDRPTARPLEGLLVLSETKPDFMSGMNESRWTFFYPDGRRVEKTVATKMYMPHEIVAMLRWCGFDVVSLLGSREGEAFTMDSKRCIAVARKP